MKAKRFMLVVAVVCVTLLCAGTSFAYMTKVGSLAMLNSTEEDAQKSAAEQFSSGAVTLFMTERYDMITYVFYDSLMSVQMALNADEIQEMLLPKAVAEYVMRVNDNYKIAAIGYSIPAPSYSLSLGFRKSDDPAMRNRFNDALKAMKADGTLAILRERYIDEAGTTEPAAVKFDSFEGADTVKVAITGDLPPIDYVAPDGKPAGFNTAVLAEIAKRLKLNIELVNINSGARAASLEKAREKPQML